MVILGIDPGSIVSGFAIIKKEGKKTFVLDFGFLKMNSKEHISLRVGRFHDFFKEKISIFKVTNLALETPFLGKNAQTFLKLGYLRGILYLLSSQNNLKLHEFSPRQVKQSVVGFGGATKEQVALMILRMFPKLNDLGKTVKNDVTDAFAVSICAVWQNNLHSF